jgi:hypothetical protein
LFPKNGLTCALYLSSILLITGCESRSYDQLTIQDSGGSDLEVMKVYHDSEIPESVLPNFNLYLSKVAPKNYTIIKNEKPIDTKLSLDVEGTMTFYCGLLKDELGKVYSFEYGEVIFAENNRDPLYFSSISDEKYPCGGGFESEKGHTIREYRSDK